MCAKLTKQIESTMRAIPSKKSKAVAGYFEGKYYLSFPNGKTLVYDELLACWTVYSNIKADVFVTYEGILILEAIQMRMSFILNIMMMESQFLFAWKPFILILVRMTKFIHRIWLHSNQPNGYRLGVKLDFETKQVEGTRPNAANVSNWDGRLLSF